MKKLLKSILQKMKQTQKFLLFLVNGIQELIVYQEHRHFIMSDNSAIRNHHNELPSVRVLYSENFDGNQNRIVYQNSLWHHYYAFDKDFITAVLKNFPPKTIDAIKKLDMKVLKRILAIYDTLHEKLQFLSSGV